MALPLISVPAAPNVPSAPGVPPVLRSIGTVVNTVVLLAADAKALLALFAGPRWGLYVNGAPVLVGDSVVALDVRQEYHISDFPLEDGGFASYDKVVMPGDLRVSLSVSGQGSLLASLAGGLISLVTFSGPTQQETRRREFLLAMKALAASLQLIDVIVPEGTYTRYNITHYDFRRDAREGATLLRIDVWLQEVRRAPSGTFTNPPAAATPPPTPITAPKSPGSAGATSTGTVQANPITPAQQGTNLPGAGGPGSGVETGSGRGTVIDVGSPGPPGNPGALFDRNGYPMGHAGQ